MKKFANCALWELIEIWDDVGSGISTIRAIEYYEIDHAYHAARSAFSMMDNNEDDDDLYEYICMC
jgi:hypothetical protein